MTVRIHLGNVTHQWWPDQCRKRGHLRSPEDTRPVTETSYSTVIRPGTIIVWSDRKAYEIVEITERPLDLWPQHYRNEWDRYTAWWAEQVVSGRNMGTQPEKATWEHRP